MTTGLARYRLFLGRPHVVSLLAWSVLARLPMGMVPLGLILLIRGEGRGYAGAGAVAAAYTVALAIGAPIGGRLVDRHGRLHVLVPRAFLYPLLLASVGVLALLDAPVWAIGVAAACAGGLMPPIGASVRTIWPKVVGGELVSTAYALEASFQEVYFLIGPLLVASLAVWDPVAAIFFSAGVAGVATIAFTRIEPVRAPHERAPGHAEVSLLGALAAPGVRTMVAMSLAIGTAFGAAEVSMPAFAELHGERELGGVLLAFFAAGSLVGGLVAGALPHGDPGRRLVIGGWVLAFAIALPLAAGSLAAMCVLIFLAGLPIAPTAAALYGLVDRAAIAATHAETFAWIGTAIATGLAIGTAIGGVLIDDGGFRSSLLLAVGAVVVGATLVTLRRRTVLEPAPEAALEPAG